MSFTFANAAHPGSPREPKCSGTGTAPKLEEVFVKKVNDELEHNIIELEVEKFSESLVQQPQVPYDTQKYRGVENKLGDLAGCHDENDVYPTLVR